MWFLLGAGSGASWGVADFFGGLQSRRLAPLPVAFWSQLVGGLALLLALAVSRTPFALGSVLWGLVAGIAGGLGLGCFYRALAIGLMSLVAPISACGALVPVAVALARGERLGLLPWLGVVAALGGILLVSLHIGPADGAGATIRRSIGLALGAALGFGFMLVGLGVGASVPGAQPLWTVAGARLTVLATIGLLIAAGPRALPWPGRQIGAVAAVGLLDTLANVLFALASRSGTLGIVGILGSLYPVVTVLLGWLVLRERLSRVQGGGAALALLGVVLLSAR
jgi:drug/metabolite transporter (DMT)-like permease